MTASVGKGGLPTWKDMHMTGSGSMEARRVSGLKHGQLMGQDMRARFKRERSTGKASIVGLMGATILVNFQEA
jgi:hypothetical protein